MNMRTRYRFVCVLIAASLTTATLSAQVDGSFAQAQRANAEKLRQYTWKSRTEVQKKGTTKSVQLMLVRYDTRGQLQATPLSNTTAQVPELGLRGHIARKKKEDLLQTIEYLKALVATYRDLPPDEIQSLMACATAAQGQLRASGTNLIQRGDALTVWMDPATRKLRKVEIITALDKNTVRAVFEFQDLPNGPTTMERSVIQYPVDELTLLTENFDFAKATP
jgi:hypothetical protein